MVKCGSQCFRHYTYLPTYIYRTLIAAREYVCRLFIYCNHWKIQLSKNRLKKCSTSYYFVDMYLRGVGGYSSVPRTTLQWLLSVV